MGKVNIFKLWAYWTVICDVFFIKQIKRKIIIKIMIVGLLGFGFSPKILPLLPQTPSFMLKDLTSSYRVDWVGNSFSGVKIIGTDLRQHVQQQVEDLFVTTDGYCYTDAKWDERFAQASVYKDGEQIAISEKMMGNRKKGGYAVVANQMYAFVAVEISSSKLSGANEFGNPIAPSQSETWYGIRRYHSKTGKIAGFKRGYGIDGATIVVNNHPNGHVQGLAISKQYLYVSDPVNNKIKVYDLDNLAQEPITSWSTENPGKIAIDNEGFLWVVTYDTNRITRFSPKGQATGQKIVLPTNSIAYDIAIDPQNRLLVTDMGEDRNIKIYGDIATHPVYQTSLGEKGGLFSSESSEIGKTGDLKFYKPKGVGSDSQGNIYVADDAWSAISGGGTILSSYQPDGKLRWRIFSLEFMSGLDLDPANERALYSKERLYYFDRDLPPGKTAQYQYTTLDPEQYPDDPRLHQHFIGIQMRRLKDKLMFFTTQRNGNQIAAFRFDEDKNSAIAIPYAMFSLASSKPVLPHEPKGKSWIWIDRNFNGHIEPEEFATTSSKATRSVAKKRKKAKAKNIRTTDWMVEPNGDLWAVLKTSILKFPISQQENEYPSWSFTDVEEYQIPAPLTEVRRFFYDSETDSAYIAGYTEDSPYSGNWKAIGTRLARFDSWSSQPKLCWILDTPWNPASKDGRQKPIALDAEGDYVFIGLGSTGKVPDPLEQSTVFVYSKIDGKYIGSMQQGDSVAPIMLDKGQGLNARKNIDGSYLVFLEDAAFARSVIFHWQP
jgi:hypothetical protein